MHEAIEVESASAVLCCQQPISCGSISLFSLLRARIADRAYDPDCLDVHHLHAPRDK